MEGNGEEKEEKKEEEEEEKIEKELIEIFKKMKPGLHSILSIYKALDAMLSEGMLDEALRMASDVLAKDIRENKKKEAMKIAKHMSEIINLTIKNFKGTATSMVLYRVAASLVSIALLIDYAECRSKSSAPECFSAINVSQNFLWHLKILIGAALDLVTDFDEMDVAFLLKPLGPKEAVERYNLAIKKYAGKI